MSWSRILGSATLLAFVLSLGFVGVESAIPNPTNKKYYACFSKKSGAVRLINYPKVSKCPKGWKLRTWNAKGIPGATGGAGPRGPAGPAGQTGPAGPAGAAGITRIHLTQVFSDPDVIISPQDGGTVTVTCPAGKVVGGGANNLGAAEIYIADSYANGPNGWFVRGFNTDTSANRTLEAFAICMTTDPGAVIASKKGSYSPSEKGFKPAKKKGKKKRR